MLNKDITFIYWDSSEKNMYQPIIEEAKKRGYKTKLTDNKFEKCEIGFYCQHINFPQFSKFSFIMLHDIIQAYSDWPDLWYKEPWNKYDVGILPSKQWENNWNQCSQWSYACPRRGMYKIGWPKADVINELHSKASKEDFYKKHNMDINKRTILYAPAWENDGKQDDFVKSMQKLDVNILIKQAPFPEKDYPVIVKNINEMYELHKDILGVTILPPSTNIFEAIAVSDVLVSEESSTMCEAAMMGIPAVSVSNWLIPDVVPSRFPKCDYDFVIMTLKEKLTDCVKQIIDDYDSYHQQSQVFAENTFSNIGKASSMIMDLVDDYVNNVPVRYKALEPKPRQSVPVVKNMKRKFGQFHKEYLYNYMVRYKSARALWNSLRFFKRLVCLEYFK